MIGVNVLHFGEISYCSVVNDERSQERLLEISNHDSKARLWVREFQAVLNTRWWPSAVFYPLVGLISLWHIPNIYSNFKFWYILATGSYKPHMQELLDMLLHRNRNFTIGNHHFWRKVLFSIDPHFKFLYIVKIWDHLQCIFSNSEWYIAFNTITSYFIYFVRGHHFYSGKCSLRVMLPYFHSPQEAPV